MSSNDSSIVADVALKPSLHGVQWAFWLHVLPAVLLPFAAPSPLPAIGILLLIFASWLYVRRHAVLGFGRKAIHRVLARPDGTWWIEYADARGETAQLLPDSIVTGWLLVLSFRNDNGKHRSRLILGDEADAEALRRLRVRLSDRRETKVDGKSADA